jgi:hypothetical protein
MGTEYLRHYGKRRVQKSYTAMEQERGQCGREIADSTSRPQETRSAHYLVFVFRDSRVASVVMRGKSVPSGSFPFANTPHGVSPNTTPANPDPPSNVVP